MPAHVFQDSDDEEAAPIVQSLTEFSNETIDQKVDAPLIIERLPNTFRRSNKYVPQALQQPISTVNGRSIAELEAAEKARNNIYGLNKPIQQSDDVDVPVAAPKASNERSTPRTDEEIALQELLETETSEHNLTIANTRANEISVSGNSHPDMSSLEDYETVPVESFGLAMLRGMGYDPSVEAKKNKEKEKVKRPDFLGLGASERPEESKSAEELAKKRHQKRKEERTYVPVVRINKRTGEAVKDEPFDGEHIKSEFDAEHDRIVRNKKGNSELRGQAFDDNTGSRSRKEPRRRSRSASRANTKSRRDRSRSPERNRDSRSYAERNHHSSSRYRSYDHRDEDRDRDRDRDHRSSDRRSRRDEEGRHRDSRR